MKKIGISCILVFLFTTSNAFSAAIEDDDTGIFISKSKLDIKYKDKGQTAQSTFQTQMSAIKVGVYTQQTIVNRLSNACFLGGRFGVLLSNTSDTFSDGVVSPTAISLMLPYFDIVGGQTYYSSYDTKISVLAKLGINYPIVSRESPSSGILDLNNIFSNQKSGFHVGVGFELVSGNLGASVEWTYYDSTVVFDASPKEVAMGVNELSLNFIYLFYM